MDRADFPDRAPTPGFLRLAGHPALPAAVPTRDPLRCSWRALGTSVDLVVTDPATLEDACEILDFEVRRIDAIASRFRLDSEISYLNNAGGGEIPIGPGLIEALSVALRAAELTGGLVDPTVGDALIRAGYDRDFALVAPDGPMIALEGNPAPGWRSVRLDTEVGTVRVPCGIRFDLGATAKALAADRSATSISRSLGCGVAVSLGGDVAVGGPPPAGGWSIQVVEDGGGRVPAGPAVSIGGGGLATSGTTLRCWRRGGTVLHHIIDPATGLPAESCWRTATVSAGSCVDANIAATAAILLGHEAVSWLEQRMLPARLVAVGGRVVTTAGWPEDGALFPSPPQPHRPLRRTEALARC